MRMWGVDPRILCRKHLLGYHLEMHMFLGALKEKKKLTGFYKNNLFEPKSLKKCHDLVSLEMLHRTYNHKTPMTQEEFEDGIKDLTDEERTWEIDREKSLIDLLMRCKNCGERFVYYDTLDEALKNMAQNIADEIDNEVIQSIVQNHTKFEALR